MARHRTKIISLTEENVRKLKKMLSSSKTCDTLKQRCRILLDLDTNTGKDYTDAQIARRNGVCLSTIRNVIASFTKGGLRAALHMKRNINSNNANRKVDGRIEAIIIHLACNQAPEGYARWTLRLLSKTLTVEYGITVGKDAIGRALKKTLYTPTKANTGANRTKAPNL